MAGVVGTSHIAGEKVSLQFSRMPSDILFNLLGIKCQPMKTFAGNYLTFWFDIFVCVCVLVVCTIIAMELGAAMWINSLWPSNTIWRHISGSTLAQLIACSLTASSHHLIQCYLLLVMFCGIHMRATVNAQITVLYIGFENYTFKIAAPFPRCQRVNPEVNHTYSNPCSQYSVCWRLGCLQCPILWQE